MLHFSVLIALLLLAAPIDDPCQPGYARLPDYLPESSRLCASSMSKAP